MSTEGHGSDRDHLTATTPASKIELTEEELSRTTGGAAATGKEMKIKFTSTTKDKVDPTLEL